ncbi:MAG TPA: hypothetical protein DHN33_05180, partial [Eubacteriaceae bacterium]|nr:hypothetical protein [Eubacteriaceae bacterium]
SFLEKTARLFTLAWDDDLVPIALLSISLIAMIFLLFHRSKRWKNFKGLILIYLVIYQIPYAYSLLNGLSYPQLRWIYLLAGMAGLSVAVFVQECNDLKKKEGFSLGLSLFLYLFIVWYYRSDANQTALIIGFFLFLLILMRGLGKRVPKTVRTLFPAVLLLLIALEAAVTMNHLLAEDRYGAEFETKASLQSYYDGDLQGAIDALRPEEDFYRIEVVKQDRNNLPVYYGYPSTALYNSMTNGRVIDWLFERNVGSNVLRSGYNGFDGIAAYQSFLGVKYQIIDEDEAAKPLYGSVYKRTINGYAIYQNPFAGPPAFVVGENDAGKEGFFWEMDQEGVDFQVSDVKDISLNDRTILVEEKEGFVEFILADVKEKELYFQLKNVYHEDPSKSFAVTIEEVGENNEKTREIRNRENQYYMGVHDMTMNLGASDEKERTFRLFFSKEGSYTVDSLFFSAVDWKEQVEKFEKILDKGAKHFVFEGDRMEASFDVEGPDATAVFPIPYSEGWQAEVNGVKTKPLAWQEAFIGVPVEQGNTLVTLTYRTPGLRTGAVLSVFALLGIYGLIRTENRRRNKKPS